MRVYLIKADSNNKLSHSRVLKIFPDNSEYHIVNGKCDCDGYIYRRDCIHRHLLYRNKVRISQKDINNVMVRLLDILKKLPLSASVERVEFDNGDITTIWLRGSGLGLRGIFDLAVDIVEFNVKIILV